MIGKRALQLVVAIACLLPLVAGGAGIAKGPTAFGHLAQVPRDLDSHFRYMSGIFFALGLAFTTCIPEIENKGARFRLLGGLVFVGGCARLTGWLENGPPSLGHQLGLVMETVGVPLLMLWQWRLSRRRFAFS